MISENQIKPAIFISHSSKDKYYLELFENIFRNNGIQVWIDHRYLNGGEKFAEEIIKAIRASDIVIVFWSQNAFLSNWVLKEFNIAKNENKKIIPCKLDNTELPPGLEELQIINFSFDISKGIAELMKILDCKISDAAILKNYIGIIFSNAIDFKFGINFPHDSKIPGVELKIYDQKFARWKNSGYPSSITINALSRNYLKQNYGGYLEDLFRDYLKNEGWEYKPYSTDNYGQLHYRTMTICKKGAKQFLYIFTAGQTHNDWDSQLYILTVDHIAFFNDLLNWVNNKDDQTELISDDFLIRKEEKPQSLFYKGSNLATILSFHCNLMENSEGLNWFENLLYLFTEFLGRNNYSVQNIGIDKEPLFDIHSIGSLNKAVYNEYLFEAISLKDEKNKFKFLYNSECNKNRSQGYSKISIVV